MHSILAVVTVIKIDRLYPTARSRALQPASSIYAASSFYNTEINSVHAPSNTLNSPPQIINSLCIYWSSETGKKKNWSNLPVSFTTREFELNAVQVQSQKPPGLQYTHSICVVASCQQPSHSKSSRKTNVFVALSPGILKIGRQRGAKWQDPVFAFSDIPNPCHSTAAWPCPSGQYVQARGWVQLQFPTTSLDYEPCLAVFYKL